MDFLDFYPYTGPHYGAATGRRAGGGRAKGTTSLPAIQPQMTKRGTITRAGGGKSQFITVRIRPDYGLVVRQVNNPMHPIILNSRTIPEDGLPSVRRVDSAGTWEVRTQHEVVAVGGGVKKVTTALLFFDLTGPTGTTVTSPANVISEGDATFRTLRDAGYLFFPGDPRPRLVGSSGGIIDLLSIGAPGTTTDSSQGASTVSAEEAAATEAAMAAAEAARNTANTAAVNTVAEDLLPPILNDAPDDQLLPAMNSEVPLFLDKDSFTPPPEQQPFWRRPVVIALTIAVTGGVGAVAWYAGRPPPR